MKYYVYISDSKVDMLLPQIPHERKKKIATEFGFDLKVLKATRKAEEESDENRISRLVAVVTYIQQYGNVGSLGEPDEYIQDALTMRWAVLDETLAYFTGRTEKTLVGFGGSPEHVIGARPTARLSGPAPPSSQFTMVDLLYREISGEREGRPRPDVPVLVAEAYAKMHGAEQNLEFLAKRLSLTKEFSIPNIGTTQVLLGSPLYVAMAD